MTHEMTHEKAPTAPTTEDTARLEADVAEASQPFRRLQEQMHRVIVGQQELLDGLIVGLLANGHLLIEGVPGLAKTTAIASLAPGDVLLIAGKGHEDYQIVGTTKHHFSDHEVVLETLKRI